MKWLTGLGIAGYLGFALAVILGMIGYVLNIIKLFGCDFDPVGKEEIIRGLGIIPLIGAIAGWLNF